MKAINIPKRILKSMYVGKRMTTLEISKYYHCGDETIRNYLIRYNIKRRRNAPRYIRTVKKLSKIQASYFAGIVDGEGTITIAKSTRSIGDLTPLISVANTDEKLINWLKDNIGCKVTASQPKNIKYKLHYRWYSYSVLDVYIIIKMIYPYLIIKKSNVKKVLAFCRWRLNVSKKSRKYPIVYPHEPNGHFAKVRKIIYGEYDDVITVRKQKEKFAKQLTKEE